MLGGVLLIARHSALLGALVSAAYLSNIVALNFCFDVPVKLFSVHLLAMSFLVATPDLKRLWSFFVVNRGAPPARPPILLGAGRPILERAGVVLRNLLFGAFIVMSLYGAHTMRKTYGDLAPRSPFQGVWNVESFDIDHATDPAELPADRHWKRVIFAAEGRIAIQSEANKTLRFVLKHEAGDKRFELSKRTDPSWKSALRYEQTGTDQMRIEGSFENQAIRASLRRQPESDFTLISRGFHWINEYPFNR
jgi:hypothetical protein